jgi:uncharacterized protein (TIGR03435 family)
MKVFALVTLSTVFVSPLAGQRGDSQARIEVASVKPVRGPDDPRGLSCALPYVERTGGRIWIPFSQVCGLLRVAFNLVDYQVTGLSRDTGVGPSNFFEVSVRLTDVAVPSMDDARGVLQDLLTERFRLRAHRESRDMPTYSLVATNDGPKLTPCSDPKAGSRYVPGRIVSCDPPIPMPRLLQFLSAETSRPVVDKTGLAAPTFELRWLPAGATPEADSPPGLFTAIQEQLGLKLEPSKDSVEVMVVDAVESPSPN